MNVWRLRSVGRIAGAADQPARGREFPGAARRARRCSTWRAPRTGRVRGLWALDVERKVTRRVTVRASDQYTSVSASRDGRRVVATVANPTRQPVARAAARSAGRRSRRAALRAAGARGRWPRASAAPRCSTCPTRGTGDGLWRVQDGQASEVRKGADGRLVRAARGVAGRKPRRPSSSDRRGSGTCRSCRRTARSAQALAPSHRRGRARPARRCGLVAGRHMDRDRRPRRAGPGLVQDPRRTAARPCGSSPVRRVNPVWSPKGDLIVYAVPFGRRRRPSRTPGRAPGRRPGADAGGGRLGGAHRFCRSGAGAGLPARA